MHCIHDYEVYIFDCDGVILDSNNMKINAMKMALEKNNISLKNARSCIEYFSDNFGKSRFHHIEYFLKEIIGIHENHYHLIYNSLLTEYASLCKQSYNFSPVCDGFIEFINSISGEKYVASGTDQVELCSTLLEKGLARYFISILGAPKRKTDIVKTILDNHRGKRAVMFGDAIADLEAALDNNIEFIACSQYSNTPKVLEERSKEHNFLVVNTFRDLL